MDQVVLITGANRGIGQGLAAHYLLKPDTTVIAAIRVTSTENTKGIRSLPTGQNSHLIIVPLDLENAATAAEAVSQIQTQYHINHIDVAIANAGICNHWGPAVDMTDADVLSHMEVNTLGPLRLFRATARLLQRARAPKFVYISTVVASIEEIKRIPSSTAAYGMSKVAGNYLVKKMDAENQHLVALSIDPGMVQTDMGGRAAQFNGLDKAPLTIDESVSGIIAQISAAEKSTTSGQFVRYNGDRVAW